MHEPAPVDVGHEKRDHQRNGHGKAVDDSRPSRGIDSPDGYQNDTDGEEETHAERCRGVEQVLDLVEG